MATNFLGNASLQRFFEELERFGRVHGPTLTEDGVMTFAPIDSAEELHLDYHRTLIPPKKFLIPPRETVLDFSPASGYTVREAAAGEIVLFGIHPCDLAAIEYLDRVFISERPDPCYQARRKSMTLIGLSCEADEFCFCVDTATDKPAGYDLFLERVAGGFYLREGSAKGESIIAGISYLTDAGPMTATPPCPSGIAAQIRMTAEQQHALPESPLWKDFADRCLSCGACSLCCPTCYCFDVREDGGLDGRTARRQREWDNCLFKSHGEIAGGFNFRKSREERLRYRFRHKYLGFGPLRGVVSCVGCGRCREACPVKIDLMEILTRTH